MGTLGEGPEAVPGPVQTMKRPVEKSTSFQRSFHGGAVPDYSNGHLDGWRSSPGALPAMEAASCLLESYFQFQNNQRLELDCFYQEQSISGHSWPAIVHLIMAKVSQSALNAMHGSFLSFCTSPLTFLSFLWGGSLLAFSGGKQDTN